MERRIHLHGNTPPALRAGDGQTLLSSRSTMSGFRRIPGRSDTAPRPTPRAPMHLHRRRALSPRDERRQVTRLPLARARYAPLGARNLSSSWLSASLLLGWRSVCHRSLNLLDLQVAVRVPLVPAGRVSLASSFEPVLGIFFAHEMLFRLCAARLPRYGSRLFGAPCKNSQQRFPRHRTRTRRMTASTPGQHRAPGSRRLLR